MTRRHNSSTVWVDKSSKYLFVNHNEKNDTAHALSSKIEFEKFADRHHRRIRHIHSDNGIFTSKAFVSSCAHQHQKQTLCGVGAHHQNGMAERYIGVVTGKARTMLLHVMRHWPDIVTPEFWTYALSHAKNSHIWTPRHGEKTCPHEQFTNEVPPVTPGDFKLFDCPVYVLSKGIQDGNQTQKFSKARSNMGVYVGSIHGTRW